MDQNKIEDVLDPKLGISLTELKIINLQQGDVLSVKLVGDDFDANIMENLRYHLNQVFTRNKVMVFTMPTGSDIIFEAITQPTSYCDNCNCGKKELKLEEEQENG